MTGSWLKTLLLIIGILALLVSTITYTPLAKFVGMHTFTYGKDVNCTECHPGEAGNLSLSVYHSGMSCRRCHNTSFSSGYEAHAASIPRCTNANCHSGVVGEINDTYEAHMPLFRSARNQKVSIGPNEACLACHTNTSTPLKFYYYSYINYTVIDNGTPGPRTNTYYYLLENVSYGPRRSYMVNITKPGGSHYWRNKTDISCVGCHERVKLGNIGSKQGAQHAGDVVDKDDPGHQNASYGGATDAYCKSCHYNTTFNSYPGLNTSKVHIAIELSCTTCHNSSGPWPPANETIDKGGHYSEDFYPRAANNIPRRLMGDFCTGCHHAKNHDVTEFEFGGGGCNQGICHYGNTRGRNLEVNNWVFTEPDASETTYWVNRSYP